jgi:hypothetical protein
MTTVSLSETTFHTILRVSFCESGHIENNALCSFLSVLLSSLLNYTSLFSSLLPFSFPYFSSLGNTECYKNKKKSLCFIYFCLYSLAFFSLSIFLLCRVLPGLNYNCLNNKMWHKNYMWFKRSANITVGCLWHVSINGT